MMHGRFILGRSLSALITVLLFGVSFVAAFAAGQFLATRAVFASHASPNPCANNDAEYWHIHWEWLGGSPVYVNYGISILDESGETGVYEPLIEDMVAEWNADQNFVELVQGAYDILVTVDDFTGFVQWLGDTDLISSSGARCTTNNSTHAEWYGDSYIHWTPNRSNLTMNMTTITPGSMSFYTNSVTHWGSATMTTTLPRA